jgi:UDP-3-O-[3-hydroxymyristoyl] N-acetylglucosamine deacetylase
MAAKSSTRRLKLSKNMKPFVSRVVKHGLVQEAFKEQIAPARTFGFLKDVEMMERMGMGEGGRLHNFILVDDEKIVNTELRFPDEFARHKILDLIGDFYLLNRPIRGKVTACRTGHTDNISMMKKLLEETKNNR